ncbi:MAG: cytochrome c3 family protein, partial [Polyangiaceae bacterium]
MTARTHHLLGSGWLALLLVVAALAAACAERPAPRFPHKLHLAGLSCGSPGQAPCLSCTSCHAVAQRGGHALPSVGSCASCHRNDHTLLQAVISAPRPRPYGTIAFDHGQHLRMPDVAGQCVPCHAGVVEAGSARLPPMKQCLGCHEHEAQWNLGQCAPCHALPEIKRALPQTFLKHEGDFMQHHGTEAVQQKKLCQACHAQADCEGCHDASQDLSIERRRPEAVTSTFAHRGDFMSRHA